MTWPRYAPMADEDKEYADSLYADERIEFLEEARRSPSREPCWAREGWTYSPGRANKDIDDDDQDGRGLKRGRPLRRRTATFSPSPARSASGTPPPAQRRLRVEVTGTPPTRPRRRTLTRQVASAHEQDLPSTPGKMDLPTTPTKVQTGSVCKEEDDDPFKRELEALWGISLSDSPAVSSAGTPLSTPKKAKARRKEHDEDGLDSLWGNSLSASASDAVQSSPRVPRKVEGEKTTQEAPSAPLPTPLPIRIKEDEVWASQVLQSHSLASTVSATPKAADRTFREVLPRWQKAGNLVQEQRARQRRMSRH